MYRQAIAALIILGLAPVAAAQTMLECAELEDQAARLECYDEVAGRVEKEMEKPAPGPAEHRVEKRNESIVEEVVGARADEAVAEETVEIRKVIRDRNRRVIYQLSDGRYFRRSSSSRVTFRAGDVCTFEDGMMSAVFLVREDGKRNKVKELSVD